MNKPSNKPKTRVSVRFFYNIGISKNIFLKKNFSGRGQQIPPNPPFVKGGAMSGGKNGTRATSPHPAACAGQALSY